MAIAACVEQCSGHQGFQTAPPSLLNASGYDRPVPRFQNSRNSIYGTSPVNLTETSGGVARPRVTEQ